MAAASVIAVLVVGNLLGAFIKGITGFGSAILALCVWIVATCVGIDAGTLQQAVFTECIASMVLAVPLLCMTKAHATCDWALVFSLSLFGAFGAPVGAAMLTHLPARQVEFAVGLLMLLVILLNARKAASQKPQPEPVCADAAAASRAAAEWPADSDESCQQQLASCHGGVELLVVVAAAGPAAAGDATRAEPHCSLRDVQLVLPAGADDVSTLEPDSPAALQRAHSSGSSRSSFAADGQCICIINSPAQLQDGGAEADQEGASLLRSDFAKPTSNNSMQHAAPDSDTCNHHLHARPGVRARWQAWWASVTQPETLAAFRRMLLMGSLAGCASGVMAGLTGMGGPPVMLLFERLQVPKDVVRGTNAVCNVLQARVLVYLALGVFSKSDLVLYAAVSVAAVVGMFLGCLAAARTNQAMFSRMLTGLMVLCCVLMFASSAGIAGHSLQAAPGHHAST